MLSGAAKSWGVVACLATFLSGCGSIASTPTNLPGISGGPSWMARAAKAGDLLYLSDVKTNAVDVYSFPRGRLVGTLTAFGEPRSECSDGAGDVWIADIGGYDVIEYPHGGSAPIVALSTPGAPLGCSVSPVTGDLAVTSNANGAILSVFHYGKDRRWRDPQVYGDSGFRASDFCGYDARGNLFLDGRDKAGSFRLAELARGARKLTNIAVSQKFNRPGQVQWDGTYLAVGDAGGAPSKIYQFSVSGQKATEAGFTTLGRATSVRQFWIEGSHVIGPDFSKDVGFWQYPAGGSATKILRRVHGFGATVSLLR
jgi:hypothetical protein